MTQPQQSQLALGLALRDQGIDDCIAASESVLRETYLRAAEEALRRLADNGKTFTADDVRQAIPKNLMAHSHNVLPALIGRWSTRRRIVLVGYRQSTRSTRHGSRIGVWVGAEKDELLPAC